MPSIKYTDKPIPKPGKQPKKVLNIEVDIKNTDLFQDLLRIIKDVVEDKRIHKPVRSEYLDKVEYLIGKYI